MGSIGKYTESQTEGDGVGVEGVVLDSMIIEDDGEFHKYLGPLNSR